MTRLGFLAVAAGAALIGCEGLSTGPAGDFPVEIEILRAHTIAVAMIGDAPMVLVEARITNPGSTEVLVQPECGGPFGPRPLSLHVVRLTPPEYSGPGPSVLSEIRSTLTVVESARSDPLSRYPGRGLA